MKALQLIAQRLILLAVVLLIVSVLTFAIVNILPGDVANAILGDLGTPAQVVALRKQMGLDLPLATRYGTWMVGAAARQFRPLSAVRCANRPDADGSASQLRNPRRH